MDWVNLHAHSEGSLLDGAGTPQQRAEQAKALGQKGIALTDHGNLIMVPAHIKACNDVGIKPIVGVEAYFKPDRNKKDKKNAKAYHLLLLAQNEKGWKNLIKLTSEAYMSGFYHKPCTDWELLEKYGEGLICSSACVSGYLSTLLQEGSDKDIHETVERHLNIFGDNYFFEIMPHDFPAQKVVNARLANLSLEYDIPLVATGDSHYPYENWKPTQDVLLMIATGQSRKKREKRREEGEDVYEINMPLHMFSEDEMYELFAANHSYLTGATVKGAINQAGLICDLVEGFEIDSSLKIPRAAKTKDEATDIIHEWAIEGLKRIGKTKDQVYLDRLKRELDTFEEMGVMQYFVLVGKIVRWARSQDIRISSGRGSASGSLVCYLINITTIDPIAYDLLFERFMNPNRKGMPDIDIDFDSERREEVIDYAKQEFGEESVANILTLGTFGPKSALKDVSRVLDVPFQEINVVTKVIPDPRDVGGAGNVPPLAECRSLYGAIDEYAKKYPEVWDHAIRIEGHVRGIGKHAGGIIVTDKPIVEYMPLMRGKTSIVTGWSDTAKFAVISDLGFMKIDILSLEGLSKQGETVKLIEQRHNTKINLDDLAVARDPQAIEPEVMEIFQKGQTLGVFQFGGSKGITNFLRQIKPDRMEDLIAANALYRPGGIEGGDAFKYGDLKHGKQPIVYWHESVKPFLEKTYGVMAYQEQMQQIVQALGKFTPGESDDMRKATSKLYRMGKVEAQQFMGQYKEQWMKGCKENGLNEVESEDIWERMLAFGGYSFNKSHSASYSLAAYQDAWLKCHYPAEFYSPLLTREDDRDPVVREARQRDLFILPPDINDSDPEFTIVDNKLLYGLLSVKNLGDVAVNEIMAHRPYESLDDFKKKIQKAKCNSRATKFLVQAGAFDSLGERQDVEIQDKRILELEALGVAISGTGESQKYATILEERINRSADFENLEEGTSVVIGGEIASVKHHTIKSGKNKGKLMGFFEVVYTDNIWKCTIFKDNYEKYLDLIKDGNIVMIRGKKGEREEVLVNSMVDIRDLEAALNE